MRKKSGIIGIAVLLVCFAFVAGTVAFAQSDTPTQTKAITVTGVSAWQYENNVSYYAEITVAEDAFSENGAAMGYHIAEEGGAYRYIQDYVSIRLDNEEWRTVKEISADASKYTYPDEGTPFWHIKEPVVIFGQDTKILRLYFHKDFVGIAKTVGVRLEKGLYVHVNNIRYELPETIECEHTESGWKIRYDTRSEPLGLSAVTGWASRNNEWNECDVYFSRKVFLKTSGKPLEYDIMDKSACFYLQDLIFVNGKSMREINQTTDIEGWSFTGFPHELDTKYDGVHYAYRTPVFIFSKAGNHMQIRIHVNYLETLTEQVKITFKAGKYATVIQKKESGGMEAVEYSFEEDFSVTKNDGNEWIPSGDWTPYSEPEEIIDRKDIDFDSIAYDTLRVRSVSPIAEYGNNILHKGLKVKNQYITVYFDKPVCNQYIPYASYGKSFLESQMSAFSLTQAQVDSLYDYRIDESLNHHIKIDGLTVAEMKAREMINGESAVRIDYAGTSGSTYSITVYLAAESLSWLAPYTSHTFEITAGFRTPLFGEVKHDTVFYYDPVTRTWSETDYEANSEWGNPQSPAIHPTVKGCGGIVIGLAVGISVAVVVLAAGVAVFVWYRNKKGKGATE